MSVEIRGSAVVKIPVPETLMKVTPVIMVIIQNDSKADLSSFSDDSDRTFPSSFGESLSFSKTTLSRVSSHDSANAGTSEVSVVTVVMAVKAAWREGYERNRIQGIP